jgi:hypothetical protein
MAAARQRAGRPPAGTPVTYVYGIVPAGTSRGVNARGIGEAPVRDVAHEDLAALVSVVPAPVRAKRRELFAHAEVLNAAAEAGPVLPFRFGETFPDEETLVTGFLRPRHKELSGMLEKFENRVELTVRAFYEPDVILAEIVRSNPHIARLRELTSRGHKGATQGALVELGSAVAAELETRSRRDAAAIVDELRPLAVDVHVGEPHLEHQLLAASLLVNRRDLVDVDRAMNELARRHAGRIEFKYVGPLAPHSFVSLSNGRA